MNLISRLTRNLGIFRGSQKVLRVFFHLLALDHVLRGFERLVKWCLDRGESRRPLWTTAQWGKSADAIGIISTLRLTKIEWLNRDDSNGVRCHQVLYGVPSDEIAVDALCTFIIPRLPLSRTGSSPIVTCQSGRSVMGSGTVGDTPTAARSRKL